MRQWENNHIANQLQWRTMRNDDTIEKQKMLGVTVLHNGGNDMQTIRGRRRGLF